MISAPFFRTWVLTACVASMSCSAAEVTKMPLTGRLIYVGSSAVSEIDLASLKRRTIYEHGALLQGQLTRVGNGAFVVESHDGEMLLVTPVAAVVTLGKGSKPVYIAAHHKLLYYASKPNERRPRLYAARLTDGALENPREVDEGPFGTALPVIPISDDEVVFERSVAAGQRVFKHNLRTSRTTALPVQGCLPYTWRAATAQLICGSAEAVSLVSLDGQATEVPALRGLAVGVYDESRDALFVSRERMSARGPINDLFVYNFRSGTLSKVADEISIGAGTAFLTK